MLEFLTKTIADQKREFDSFFKEWDACLLKYDMPLEKPDDDPAATEVGKENPGPDPSIEDEGRINISVICYQLA